jgi:tetratricopeptide (TPR) repeat protein
MSPEQIGAGRVKLDHRTDIYSLGAVLYEMLTLERPFPGGSREEILTGIMTRDPRPPRKINGRIPVDLETICLKAMEKNPSRRYETAGEMADDLRKYAQGGLIAARRAGPLRRLNKLVRRHPVAVVSTVALIAILGLGGFAFRQSSRGAQQAAMRAVSDARFFLAQGDYRKGLETIDGVLADASGLSEARLLRARLLIKLSRYPDAVGEAEALLADDPDDWRGHLILALAAGAPDLGDRVKTLSAKEHMQAVAAGAPETADAFFLQGLFEESDADALELLDRAIELDPTHADALLERCRRQIERKNFQAALLDGERLAALRPRSAQGRRMIGEIHFHLHDTQQALTELERAIQLDPNDPLTLWQRSDVYATLVRYEDELADLNRAIELDSVYARYYEQRAWALMRLGRNEEALADAERAIELNPEFIGAYGALAATYESMGDPAKRVEIYSKLRDESASWKDADARIEALYEVGEVYFRQGDFAGLAGLLDEMEQLDRDSSDVPVMRAVLAKLSGDEAELSAACARLEGVELTDLDKAGMLAQGFGYFCDRPDAGIAVYSKLIATLPDWADAYAGRARLYAEEDRYEESLADQARAIALAPRWAEAYRTRSYTYRALERYDEALEDIDQFFALGEESGPARQTRAIILLRLGRQEEALEDLDRMVAWNPKAGHPYRQRGYVKMQLGRLDEALADAERCLELQPGDTWGYRDRAEYGLLLTSSCEGAMRDAEKAEELSDEFDPTQSWWMARFHISYLAGRCPEFYDPAKALELARVPAERLDYGRQTYGLALYRNGRFDEARQVLEQVLEEENPPEPLTLYGLAMTLAQLGDRDAGERLATRARARVEATWPDNPIYLAYAEEAAALLRKP